MRSDQGKHRRARPSAPECLLPDQNQAQRRSGHSAHLAEEQPPRPQLQSSVQRVRVRVEIVVVMAVVLRTTGELLVVQWVVRQGEVAGWVEL